jgi:hypothetical protein
MKRTSGIGNKCKSEDPMGWGKVEREKKLLR